MTEGFPFLQTIVMVVVMLLMAGGAVLMSNRQARAFDRDRAARMAARERKAGSSLHSMPDDRPLT